MFTICVPLLRTGCSGPVDATVGITWSNAEDPFTCDHSSVTVTQTWTNPCPVAYAISYSYELEWDDDTGPHILLTTSPETATLAASTTTVIGPADYTVWADARLYFSGRVRLWVTWPDTTVTSYVSADDFLDHCA